jgi:pimeloyl-ACP methyl ester carboxylesterase
MKSIKSFFVVIVATLLLTGCSKQQLELNKVSKIQPINSVYLKGNINKALILAHGQGKYPTWKVVNPLRKSINSELGYHTLSLQMPNNKDKWKDYADDFPKAYDIIKQAIVFLQNKGVKDIYLMGHSMGSRMTSSFLSEFDNLPIKGFIAVGCRNNGGYPFSCIDNVKNIKNIPILDIWGGDNKKDNKSAHQRSYLVSDTYTQVSIYGANHKLDGYDDELKDAIIHWINDIN